MGIHMPFQGGLAAPAGGPGCIRARAGGHGTKETTRPARTHRNICRIQVVDLHPIGGWWRPPPDALPPHRSSRRGGHRQASAASGRDPDPSSRSGATAPALRRICRAKAPATSPHRPSQVLAPSATTEEPHTPHTRENLKISQLEPHYFYIYICICIYIHMFYMYITLHYTHCITYITYTAYITCITYVIYTYITYNILHT